MGLYFLFTFQKCLVFKQSVRISAQAALKHAYFTADESANESSMYDGHDTSASSLTSGDSMTEENDQSACSESLSD